MALPRCLSPPTLVSLCSLFPLCLCLHLLFLRAWSRVRPPRGPAFKEAVRLGCRTCPCVSSRVSVSVGRVPGTSPAAPWPRPCFPLCLPFLLLVSLTPLRGRVFVSLLPPRLWLLLLVRRPRQPDRAASPLSRPKLLAPQSSRPSSDFQEVNTAPLGPPVPTSPVSYGRGLRPGAPAPRPTSRALGTGHLRREGPLGREAPSLSLQCEVWHRGPPHSSPQNAASPAPGLPGNLGKTEPECHLRTGLHLTGL